MCAYIQELIEKVLCEAHCSEYTIHVEVNKMYKNMMMMYWWKCKKNDEKNFVSKYLTCQQVMFEHQRQAESCGHFTLRC